MEVKAVNIGGTTYSPNRAIANALNQDIDFKNNQVSFTSRPEVVFTDLTINELDEKIKSAQGLIKAYEILLLTPSSENKTDEINQKIAEQQEKIKKLEEARIYVESQLQTQQP